MGILKHSSNFQNCIKLTNKIPVYARDYKNEWLLIRGINKEFKYFVDNIDEARSGLFENPRVDTIKKYIKKFLLLQERGKLKDTNNFEFINLDLENLIKIEIIFCNFKQYILFCECCFHEEDEIFLNPYPGFKNIYDDFELFFSKFKIKYEEGSSFWDYCDYSESDGDYIDDNDVIEDELPINDVIEDELPINDDYVFEDILPIDDYDFEAISPPIIDSDSDSDSDSD